MSEPGASHESPDPPGAVPPGSLADEAARLLDAVQGWLGERVSSVAAAAGEAGGTTGHEHGAFDSPTCRVCPVCKVIHAVTTVDPQVLTHLSEAAGSFLSAMRLMTDPPSRPDPEEHA